MNSLTKAIKFALYGCVAVPFTLNAQETLEPIEVSTSALGSGHSTEGTGNYTAPVVKSSNGLELSPQETPQSVSVITHQQIRDQNLNSIAKALESVTGVAVNQVDRGRYSFSARGFNIDKYRIDGLSVNWRPEWQTGETTTDNAIYDRIEVVRGANGLMTGAGNPSAGVNLIRKRADRKEAYTIIEGGIGNRGYLNGMIDQIVPLMADGSVRGRFVAAYQGGKTFVDREKNRIGTLYGVIDADLSDSTKLSAGISYNTIDKDSAMWGGLPAFFEDGSPTNWVRSKNSSTDWSYWDNKVTNYFVDVEQKIGENWKVNLKGNQRNVESESKLFYFSGKGTVNRGDGLGWEVSPNLFRTDTKQSALEIGVDGKFTLWGLEHNVVAGAQYSRHHRTSQAGDWRTISANAAPATDFNIWNGSYPEPNWGQTSMTYDQKVIEKGAYLAARLRVTQNFFAVLGSRISTYESGGISYGSSLKYKVNSEWTPYAGLVYNITPNQSLYVSYTDIFKPQTNVDINNKLLDPEVGRSYETGWKGSFLNNGLETQVSVFRTEQDNLAESTNEKIPGTDLTAYRAVNGAVVKGFEAEVTGNITSQWKVTAGYSQWKGRNNKRVPINTDNPNKQFKIFSSYDLNKVVKGLTVGGGVNWQNRTYATNPTYGKNAQGSYALVNLMVRYQVTENFSAQLNLNNLLDKKHRKALSRSQYNYGEPFYSNLTLRYEF